jgi:hypothetical protein
MQTEPQEPLHAETERAPTDKKAWSAPQVIGGTISDAEASANLSADNTVAS